MIKNTLFISLLLLVSLMSFGQDNNSFIRKHWNIETGYQNLRILDKNASPLIYIANNGLLSFQFQKIKKNIWSIGGAFSLGSNQSKRFGQRSAVIYDDYDINGHRDSTVYIINPSLSFIQASLFYSYYWKLKNKMYAGGTIKDNFYYSALGTDTWFFNQLSIMPSYRTELFNKFRYRIDAEVSIPIFSYLLRQPYALDPSLPVNNYFIAYLKTGSALATINKFQQVNINVKFANKLNNGNQIGLSYYFMWMKYTNISERDLNAYSNSILISYSF